MMTLSLIMFPTEMMSASPNVICKHRIIARENKLAELSMDFSVDVINLVKHLKSNHESIISNQIGRSGTSIGANIHEA